jgi:hypothetical protein
LVGAEKIKGEKAKTYETDDGIEDVDENEGYVCIWNLVKRRNKDRFNKFYDQYNKDGESDENASEMAKEHTHPYKERTFLTYIKSCLKSTGLH